MADNTSQTGTDTISTDDVGGGVKVQRVKVQYGPDGSATDVSTSTGMPIAGSQPTSATTASWTSATSVNTTAAVTVTGYNTVSFALVQGTTITGGVVTFEVSLDNTNWIPIAMNRIDAFTAATTYTLVASTNVGFTGSVDAFNYFRIRLSTVISGSGTVAVGLMPQAFPVEPTVTIGQSVAANLNAQATLQTQTDTVMIGGVNVKEINAVAPLMGNGSTGTGSQRVTIASDNTANSNPWLVRHAASTTSAGLTIHKVLAAGSNNAANIKNGAGAIYGWHLVNNATSTRYVRFFNKASSPTVGTDSPAFVIPLPASGGAVMQPGIMNIALGTGYSFAITGAAADLDNTSVTANDVVGTIWYI